MPTVRCLCFASAPTKRKADLASLRFDAAIGATPDVAASLIAACAKKTPGVKLIGSGRRYSFWKRLRGGHYCRCDAPEFRRAAFASGDTLAVVVEEVNHDVAYLSDKRNWKTQRVEHATHGRVTGYFLRMPGDEEAWDFRFYTKASGVPDAGLGLFAARDFAPAGRPRLAVYCGKVVARTVVGPYVMEIQPNGQSMVRLDAGARAWDWCPVKFVNSSCGPDGLKVPGVDKPNARMLNNGAIVLIAAIRLDDEIIMSYGRKFGFRAE